MDLDEDTLALLGWGTDASDSTTHYLSGPKPSRIAPGDVDGRSKRNWRRKAASRLATSEVAHGSTNRATTPDTRNSDPAGAS